MGELLGEVKQQIHTHLRYFRKWRNSGGKQWNVSLFTLSQNICKKYLLF